MVLSRNNIGATGAQALAQSLPGSNLSSLDLGYNNIGDTGAQALAQGLPGSNLLSLNLQVNNIGDTGAQGLGQGLPGSNLLSLDLQRNNIGDAGAQALGQGLPGSNLLSLDLQRNNIGDAGAQALGQGLPGSTLLLLNLYYNNIGGSGTQGLGQGLSGSSLQTLVLSGNIIGAVGAQGLGQGLPGSNLQTLNLQGNNIDATGAQALGQGLSGSNLLSLYLRYNHIGDAGAIALANILTPVAIPSELWIQQFDFTLKRKIGQFEPPCPLQELDLTINHISDTGAKTLCQILPYTHIYHDDLALDDNPINDQNILDTCGLPSAASRTELPLPFRLLRQFYRFLKDTLFPQQRQYNSHWIEEISPNQQDIIDIVREQTEKEKIEYQEILFDFSSSTQNNFNPALPGIQHQNDISTLPVFATTLLFSVLFLLFFKRFFNTQDEYYPHRKKKRSSLNMTHNTHILFHKRKNSSIGVNKKQSEQSLVEDHSVNNPNHYWSTPL